MAMLKNNKNDLLILNAQFAPVNPLSQIQVYCLVKILFGALLLWKLL